MTSISPQIGASLPSLIKDMLAIFSCLETFRIGHRYYPSKFVFLPIKHDPPWMPRDLCLNKPGLSVLVVICCKKLVFNEIVHLAPKKQARRLLDSYNRTMVMALEKQNDEDSGVIVYDCIVCLCEVSPRDEYKVLPNCNHGVQFHAHGIDAWLKDHSSCPMCRSHIPRPLSQCFLKMSYLIVTLP
ncbi:zinc finger, RING/FYVE/PHD-type containing protein [Tanacetum coccineum]